MLQGCTSEMIYIVFLGKKEKYFQGLMNLIGVLSDYRVVGG